MSARGRSAEIAAENGEAGVADGGPGLAYMSFVVMEDLLDKLKLLNYEEVRVLKHIGMGASPSCPLNLSYYCVYLVEKWRNQDKGLC